MAENTKPTLTLDEIFSSTTTEVSPTQVEGTAMSLDEIFAPSEPINTKDDSGLVQFAGASKEHFTVEDAPAVVEETSVDLADVQRTLAKDKQIAAATAPVTPQVPESGFAMPKVDLTKTSADQSTDKGLAASSPLVKKQIGSLLAPKQESIVEATYDDFVGALPAAEDSAWQRIKPLPTTVDTDTVNRGLTGYLVKNLLSKDKIIDKETIRSFFKKGEDGAYHLPNGKTIHSDALLDQFVDNYYIERNHPIFMEKDENYRRNFFKRTFNQTEEEFVADRTAAMDAQLDRLEEAYKKVKDASVSVEDMEREARANLFKEYQPYTQEDAVWRVLKDVRKSINSARKNSFGSGFREGFSWEDIATYGLAGLGSSVYQLQALNKFVNGEELTPEENLFVEANKLSQQVNEFRETYTNSSANRIGNIVAFMPTFAVQMGATSVVPKIGAKALKEITTEVVSNALKQSTLAGLKAASKKASLSMLNDALATPLMTATYQSFADRRGRQYHWEGEELVKEKTPWATDILKALGETFVERHSEQVGDWITDGLLYSGRRLAQTKAMDGVFGRGMKAMLDYKMPPVLEQMRENLRISGYVGEVGSEIYANIINPIFTGEGESWKELTKGSYYWELLASTAIASGSFYALNVPSFVQQARAIKRTDNARNKALQSISNEPLKGLLHTISTSDNLQQDLSQLSSFDWKTVTVEDAQNASKYLFDTIQTKMLNAEIVEADRLETFMPIVQNVTSSLYSGGNIASPTMGTQLALANMTDGAPVFVLVGDVSNPETSQVVVKTMDGERKVANIEDIQSVQYVDMSDYLAEQYALMFSQSINKERLSNFMDSIRAASEDNQGNDVIGTLYAKSGYVLYPEGEVVKLVDGTTGVVVGYDNGSYLIADPNMPEMVTKVGFLNILQPKEEDALAQVETIKDIEQSGEKVDESTYVSEEEILSQKLATAAANISTDEGSDIYIIRLTDGREATVKQGNIAQFEDGRIDAELSDATVVVKFADSAEPMQISIDEVESIIEKLSTEEVIAMAKSNLEEQLSKKNLIAASVEQVGIANVVLTEGVAGQVTAILEDGQYAFTWVGEDNQPHTIPVVLDNIAEVVAPVEESAKTIEETAEIEYVEPAEVAERFEGFEPTPLNIENVDWDKLSKEDYLNISVLAYGPAETLAKSRTFYLNTKDKLPASVKKVEVQERVIENIRAQFAKLANPTEEAKLRKKLSDAEAEKVRRQNGVNAIQKDLDKFAYAMKQLGVDINEELQIAEQRETLEREKASLVEADAMLDAQHAEDSQAIMNTIVNNESTRKRIYDMYVAKGTAPEEASITSAVLWDIVSGNIKLRWEDHKTDSGSVEKGLGAELGLTKSAADKRAYKAVLAKDGESVDSYVHSLWERLDGYSNDLNDLEIKDEVLSVLQSNPNGSVALKSLYDALGVEADIEESFAMSKGDIQQQIADVDKRIAENAIAQSAFDKKVQDKVDILEGKNVTTVVKNTAKSSNFVKNTNDNEQTETYIRRDNIPPLAGRTDNSSRVDRVDATRTSNLEQSGGNIAYGRGGIRVFEQGLGGEYSWSDADNERDLRKAVSQRLVEIAEENGLFIPLNDTKSFGEKYPNRTGESIVYINKKARKVYKVKNPYAKSAIKKVAPQDAIYEHIIHNLLFPETPYKFEGISKDVDGVRIVLSQPYIENDLRPTQEQIEQALAARGLTPDGRYSYGNDLVSVTDVEGDNVILGDDGTVYFIDPIIKFKKPVEEIIEKLSERANTIDTPSPMIVDESSVPEGVDRAKWDAVVAHLREILGEENVVTDINIIRAVYDYVTGKIGKTEAEAILGENNFRLMAAPTSDIFYSDAEHAVEEIKQEKATPQQWLAMLQKNGGLKAGEDKWIGLSDWLKASDKKALTKQEVLDYIRANKIQIEEVQYGQSYIYGSAEFEALQKEYDTIRQRIIKDKHEAHEKLSNELIDKYGFADNTVDMDALNDDDYSELNELNINEWQAADIAWQELVDKYGDDFEIAFSQSGYDIYIDNNDAASSILGLSDNYKDINKTRLIYTTEGLSNKREIALTVPTIESWKENDEIHFGDADNGRAVAWIRFGETTAPKVVEEVRQAVLEEPYKAYNGHDIYRVKGTNGKHFVIYGKLKNGQMMYVPQLNGKYIGETIETAAFDTLEQAQEALNAYYKANPIRKTINERILVIDEIQSNRHQEGRKQGYRTKEETAALEAISAAREELGRDQRDFEYRTGQAWRKWQNGEISEQEYNEMWNTQFDAENKALRAKQEAFDAQLSEYKKNKKPGVIPAAPFESNWAELAFKRMLRYAAENGFDKIAWTTGTQQAERYNLNQYFSTVRRWDINTDDMPGRYYELVGGQKIGMNVSEEGVVISSSLDTLVGKSLSEIVGKEVAIKMMQMEDRTNLDDIDFQIGGEGMKAFYDKMLVSFMNKYGKKWGARVGEVTMPELDNNNTMHSVDVTPSMRESVMQGQPMFRNFKTPQGEVYGFTYNGKIYLDPTTMNVEAPIHEYTELWSAVIEKQNPELWAKGKELLKQTNMWKVVNSDPNYKNLPEDLRASETLSRIVAAEAAKKINEVSDSKNLIAKLRAWIRKFWNTLKATFSEWSAKDINSLTLREFKAMPLRDFIEGVNPLDYQVSNISGFAPSLDAKELEEIRVERKQIEEQAKANGTWLKAPNGQPTNLTPEQWITVRTRRFKEWFGDWEKTLQIEKLRKSKAISISGKEFEITDDFKQNKKNALKYSQSFTGEYTNTDTGTTIAIYRGRQNGGVNEVLQHNYKDIPHIQSIAAIPDIIKNSIYIESQPNNDVEKNPDVAEYQCYVCGLNIAGEDYTVLAKIAVDKKGNRYYDHNLTAVEKGKLIDIANNEQSAVASGFGTTPDTKSTTNSQRKYRELLSILQINSSKVVDANGEPKVVYHGTPNDFTVFDKEKRGSSTDRGIWSNGFYFSASPEYADTYAKRNGVEGKIMPLFLNARNPLFISLKNGGNEGAMYFNSLQQKYFTDDVYEDIYKVEENMARAQKELSNEIVSNGYDGIIIEYSHPTIEDEYVTFEPNQIKSVDNAGYFDPNNNDIRYTLGSEENSLVGIHNISGAKLAKALKMGGFANPSAAVIDIARQSFESYGEYSFILPKDLVAKKSGKNLGTFDRDAWTPIYPTVIYSHNKTSKANLNKLVEGLDEGLADKIKREVMMKVEGNGFYSGLQIVFLKDNGIELPIATVTPRYAGTIEDLQKLFGDKEVTYDNYKALDQADKNAVTLWIKARGNKSDIERINGLMEKYADKPKLIASYTEEIGYGQFDNLLYGLQADARNSGNPDYGKTIENAVDYIRENNLQEEFDVWETAVISNLGLDEKIQVGWTPSGDRIMRKNTLENVSAYMRKQGKNASSDHWSNSEGKMLAKLAQNFATLEQIRANKHRLLSDVDATMEIRRRMNQAAQIFMDFSKTSNLFLEEQSAYAYLEDILIGGMNPDKVVAEYNKATKRNISLTEEQKAELKELREDMNNIPVQYFETKFDRPVMFSEFAAVVAPNNMPEVIENQLREAGLNIYKYDPDVEGDRRAQTLKATASDSIRFMVEGEAVEATGLTETPAPKKETTTAEEKLQKQINSLREDLSSKKKNLKDTLLRVYEFLLSPEMAKAAEAGLSKVQYRMVLKNVKTAIEQAYGKKDMSVAIKVVDKYLSNIQDIMSQVVSRTLLKELTNILNTSVEGYTPQGVRYGKRIDEHTREVFTAIRDELAEDFEEEIIEDKDGKLKRAPAKYRLKPLAANGLDVESSFRLKTNGKLEKLKDETDDAVALIADVDVPKSEDTMDAMQKMYVYSLLHRYDNALEVNEQIGKITDEINDFDKQIKEKAAAHRQAATGTAEKEALWNDLKTLKASREAAIQNRAGLRKRYSLLLSSFVKTLENLLEKGVNDLKLEQELQVEKDLEFRRGIYRSIKDPSTKILPMADVDEEGKEKKVLKRKKILRGLTSENQFMRTFESLSKDIDVNSIPGEWLENGWFYQFMLAEGGYMYCSSWRHDTEKALTIQLNDKVKQIFGNKNWKEKFAAQSTEPMNVVAYEATRPSGLQIPYMAARTKKGRIIGGEQKNIELTIANLLYIRNTVRQNGGKAGYMSWSISEVMLDTIVEYTEKNYPQYCEFADWAVNTFLPQLYELQDAIYFQRYGTHLTKTKFYFPFVRDKRFVGQLAEVGEGEVTMPSTTVGNIVERVQSAARMDLSADMFAVMRKHIKETLDWCAYSELTHKFNQFSTSKAFRNILIEQGFDPNKLKEAFEIAIGQGKINESDNSNLTKVLNTISKNVVAGNLVFNFNAAIKQTLSMTSVLGYSASPKFWGIWAKCYFTPSIAKWGVAKIAKKLQDGSLNPEEVLDVKAFFDNWRWALKNVPTMQARWDGGNAGYEVFKAEGFARWDKVTSWIAKAGLSLNTFIDMITCANGSRAVYEYQYALNIEKGMDEEKAKKDALVKAAVLINETQQSSLDAFLSPFQSGGGIARITGASLGAYQNSAMAFARNELYNFKQIFRMMYDSNKERMIRYKAEEYRDNNGMDINVATRQATKEFKRAHWTQVNSFLHNSIISNFGWALGYSLSGVVSAFMASPGDDELKKFFNNEEVRKQFFNTFAWTTLLYQAPLAYNHPISRQLLEFTAKKLRGENFGGAFESPLVSEVEDLITAISKQWIGVLDEATGERKYQVPTTKEKSVEYIVWSFLLKSGTGLNTRIIRNLSDGIVGMVEDGVHIEDVMNIFSSPRALSRAIAGEPRKGESQKEFLDRVSFTYHMIDAGSGNYDSKWQKARIDEYITNKERLLYKDMDIDPVEVRTMEAHKKAITKNLLLQRAGRKARIKDGKVEEYKALSPKAQEMQKEMFKLTVRINILEDKLEGMIEFDTERSQILKQKFELEQELYNKWQKYLK